MGNKNIEAGSAANKNVKHGFFYNLCCRDYFAQPPVVNRLKISGTIQQPDAAATHNNLHIPPSSGVMIGGDSIRPTSSQLYVSGAGQPKMIEPNNITSTISINQPRYSYPVTGVIGPNPAAVASLVAPTSQVQAMTGSVVGPQLPPSLKYSNAGPALQTIPKDPNVPIRMQMK